ncbi:MAG: hypothetical protein JJ894_17160 [Dinoroseobacter sp.]|nr:hypothetical protein [Dinoroseobacter sp.]
MKYVSICAHLFLLCFTGPVSANCLIGESPRLLRVESGEEWILAGSHLNVPGEVQDRTAALLARLRDELAENDTHLVLITMPKRAHFVDSVAHEAMADLGLEFDAEKARDVYHENIHRLRSAGVVVPNILDLAETSDDPFFLARDHHWSPLGARMVADNIATLLSEATIISPKEVSFEFADSEITNEFVPNLERDSAAACGFEPAPLSVSYLPAIREGLELGGSDLEAALFGDEFEEDRPAAIVGTSFSNVRNRDLMGWEASIRVALKTFTTQHAHAGINMSALEVYLRHHYRAQRPWVILWESSDQSSLSEGALRLALGALHQEDCDASAFKRIGTRDITPNGWTVLTEATSLQDTWRIDVQGLPEAFRVIDLKVEYSSDSERVIRLSRSERIPSSERVAVWDVYLADILALNLGDDNPSQVSLSIPNIDTSLSVEFLACSTKF